MKDKLQYQTGFGNQFESEAVKAALIKGRNAPQKVPHGLYAEQLSGSAFTAPRQHKLRSWLYRILPSVLHGEFSKLNNKFLLSTPFNQVVSPVQMRWNAMPYPQKPTDFVRGLVTIAGNGSIETFTGAATHVYAINKSMADSYFYNSDGDLLIVPQEGKLLFKTEFGIIEVQPSEIVVIPRGIKFQVELLDKKARGYVCENYGAPFALPELGPIGANGLANPRDFEIPVAAYEEKRGNFKLITKFQGHLWQAPIKHSPLDVVAWHGNYVPYKYDLKKFNTINTVSFDHPDPSIFTVLTSPSDTAGVANVDFVIFPERWLVAENTFRPPYYHRNIMSEYMGIIYGVYDAKEEGFTPGGGSLHNCMSAHGPDNDAFVKASNAQLKPQYLKDTLAFMFESRYVWRPTAFALKAKFRQPDYLDCWKSLKSHFSEK